MPLNRRASIAVSLRGAGLERSARGRLGVLIHLNWSIADQTIMSATNFVTSIVLARHLGLDEFGFFALIWLCVLLFQALQASLISAPLLSMGPKQALLAKERFFTLMFAQQMLFSTTSVSLVVVGCAVAAISIEYNNWISLSLSLVAATLAAQVQEFARIQNYAQNRVRLAFVTGVVRNAAQLTGLLLLLNSPIEADVPMVLLVFAAAAAIGAASVMTSFPPLPASRSGLAAHIMRNYRFSRALVGSSVLQWLSGNFMLVVAGTLLGPSAVGALRAVQNLLGLAHIFFLGVDKVMLPRAAALLKHGGARPFRTLIGRLMILSVVVTGLACFVAIVMPTQLLALLYGEVYASYGGLVYGLSIAYFLGGLVVPLQIAFIALEKTHILLIGYAVSASVVLIASYPLIVAFGIWGAITTSILTTASLLTTLTVAFRKRGWTAT